MTKEEYKKWKAKENEAKAYEKNLYDKKQAFELANDLYAIIEDMSDDYYAKTYLDTIGNLVRELDSEV